MSRGKVLGVGGCRRRPRAPVISLNVLLSLGLVGARAGLINVVQ